MPINVNLPFNVCRTVQSGKVGRSGGQRRLSAFLISNGGIPCHQIAYLDRVLEEESLADDLLGLMKSGGLKMKAVPLRLGASTEDALVDKKWKVLVNQEIEIDEL